ncbi:hypothetical protein Tco_1110268 [Tanacetum coccineum]|uniref:Uncharacterized protein n=1 Tax=Tanacetum coccineum TaxID=301880 RepID=A0ABQ5IJS0_9ASTR
MTPAPRFSTLTPIPSSNANELPPITTSTFTVRSPKNTSLAFRTSTSANPDLMISPAFVEANKVLESLLKERGRLMRNEDLRTEMEYFSEEYDKEKEMKPRPFEDAPNRDGGRVERNSEGERPSERRAEDNRHQGVNLPLLLAVHLGRSENGQHLQSPTGLFADSTSCVTPFVRWIEDYPLPDGLKMLSHVGSYDEKGDPDNYLHLFEGAIPREVATNGTPNDHLESFDRFKKNSSWDNNKGKKNIDRFSPYCGSNYGLLSSLSKSPKEILATKKVAKTFEQPPRMIGSRQLHDMTKYCHFHEDHGHDT